ncbi:MAG: hypothetical protein ACXVAO_02475 [Vulcanimicrobiaceae bacterium]
MRFIKTVALIAALGLSAQFAYAAAPSSPKPHPSKAPTTALFGDWQVNTGELNYNWQTGDFTAPGHITLTRPGSDISADRANGNQRRKQAILTGHVVMHDRSGLLTGAVAANAGASTTNEPATLTCDELQVDGVHKTYIAIGNVHFVQGQRRMTSDRAIMNGLTHQLRLLGRVVLSQ